MSCRLSQYDRHISTAKHERMTNGMTTNDKKVPEVSTPDIETIATFEPRNICICGKQYKFRQGLHKHKKTCDKIWTRQIATIECENNQETIGNNQNRQKFIISTIIFSLLYTSICH